MKLKSANTTQLYWRLYRQWPAVRQAVDHRIDGQPKQTSNPHSTWAGPGGTCMRVSERHRAAYIGAAHHRGRLNSAVRGRRRAGRVPDRIHHVLHLRSADSTRQSMIEGNERICSSSPSACMQAAAIRKAHSCAHVLRPLGAVDAGRVELGDELLVHGRLRRRVRVLELRPDQIRLRGRHPSDTSFTFAYNHAHPSRLITQGSTRPLQGQVTDRC